MRELMESARFIRTDSFEKNVRLLSFSLRSQDCLAQCTMSPLYLFSVVFSFGMKDRTANPALLPAD